LQLHVKSGYLACTTYQERKTKKEDDRIFLFTGNHVFPPFVAWIGFIMTNLFQNLKRDHFAFRVPVK
jgi:hypothetical protein